MHRFTWDMHLEPINTIEPSYPIAAIPHNTAPDATSPWAMPGQYTVVLTAGGRSYTQPLTIKMDPRVNTPAAELQKQFALSKQVYDALAPIANAAAEAEHVQEQATKLHEGAGHSGAAVQVDPVLQKLKALAGGGARRARGGTPDTLSAMRGALLQLLGVFQDADVAPTSQAAAAVPELTNAVAPLLAKWDQFKKQDLAALNQQLRSAKLPEINPAVASSRPGATATNKDEE
jgi:hypothetical protein